MTKRRVKGEGRVYRRKDGRVVGEYEDTIGKKRYISGKTKSEVSAKLRKLLDGTDRGVVYDSANFSVEKYMDRWLVSIRDRVRLGTYKPYEAIVRLHIKPTLGRTKLEKLNALQLEELYQHTLDGGLSARRVRYIHVTMRKALKDAVRLQLLSRNVADAAIPPLHKSGRDREGRRAVRYLLLGRALLPRRREGQTRGGASRPAQHGAECA